MSEGWRNLLVGLVLFLAGAVLRPFLDRILPVPGRIKRVQRETDHLWQDHQKWRERQDQALEQELRAVDENRTLESATRARSREGLQCRFIQTVNDRQEETRREAEDLLDQIGWLERVWVRWRTRKLRKMMKALGVPENELDPFGRPAP